MEEEKSNVHEEKKVEVNKIKKENIEKEHSKKEENLTDKMRENPWIASTLVFGILTLILLVGNFSGGISGKIISEGDAGDTILNFVQTQTSGEGELVEVNSINDYFYEVVVLYQEQEIPLYLTKDGKNLAQGVMSLEELNQATQQTQTTEEVAEYSLEDLEKLREFSSCLAEKGLKIYGANWCGHTTRLVDTLGGFDVAGDAYVECTENKELCASEEITGYPTIKLNGEPYQGERTLESLAEATGCSVPDVSIQQNSDTQEASCS